MRRSGFASSQQHQQNYEDQWYASQPWSPQLSPTPSTGSRKTSLATPSLTSVVAAPVGNRRGSAGSGFGSNPESTAPRGVSFSIPPLDMNFDPLDTPLTSSKLGGSSPHLNSTPRDRSGSLGGGARTPRRRMSLVQHVASMRDQRLYGSQSSSRLEAALYNKSLEEDEERALADAMAAYDSADEDAPLDWDLLLKIPDPDQELLQSMFEENEYDPKSRTKKKDGRRNIHDLITRAAALKIGEVLDVRHTSSTIDENHPSSTATLILRKDLKVKGGTVPELVQVLCTPADEFGYITSDPDYEDVFLYTYPTFTTAVDLVKALHEQLSIPPPTRGEEEPDQEYMQRIIQWKADIRVPRQVSVCHIVMRWLEDYAPEASRDLLICLRDLAEALRERGCRLTAEAISLYARRKRDEGMVGAVRTLNTQAAFVPGNSKAVEEALQHLSQTGKLSARLLSSLKAVVDTEEIELAAQLCHEAFDQYARITEREALEYSDTNRTATMDRLVAKFISLSDKVTTTVVMGEELSVRRQVYKKWLAVAYLCFEMNNFDSTMAVIAGLNHYTVQRMGQTNQMKGQLHKQLKQLIKLAGPDGTFQGYKEVFRRVPAHVACVPFLGLHVTEIMVLQADMPNLLGNHKPPVINFEKRRAIYNIAHDMLKHQKFPYSARTLIRNNPGMASLLSSLPVMPSDELFRLSLRRETGTDMFS
eukprot:gnl/Hemi2/20331_TR6749_c0_g1_i1.p1 gnl/Hemi2/20331_TR6749_c0_g1~~gnl/Hemi2/20331_TR6749_c0_g1_i1.p1  ORF type:complete len:702 (+),score=193.75 gnl/Hemi2/20331_TR6749_c0_g1_i1:121-2226(+)